MIVRLMSLDDDFGVLVQAIVCPARNRMAAPLRKRVPTALRRPPRRLYDLNLLACSHSGQPPRQSCAPTEIGLSRVSGRCATRKLIVQHCTFTCSRQGWFLDCPEPVLKRQVSEKKSFGIRKNRDRTCRSTCDRVRTVSVPSSQRPRWAEGLLTNKTPRENDAT